jgi:amino acid permease
VCLQQLLHLLLRPFPPKPKQPTSLFLVVLSFPVLRSRMVAVVVVAKSGCLRLRRPAVLGHRAVSMVVVMVALTAVVMAVVMAVGMAAAVMATAMPAVMAAITRQLCLQLLR